MTRISRVAHSTFYARLDRYPNNPRFPKMFIIETQHKRIPWRWIILLQFLGSARILALFASGSMTFTMRKYIDSPFIINSVSSLDILFNLVIAAPCLYYSDRIWTRFGRRLPFIICSFIVLGTVILLLPLAGSAVPMGVLIVLWLIFWDLGATYDILVMEIVPPEQRIRSQAIGAWFFQAIILISAVVISGRFDDVVNAVGITLSGEMLIYWWGAACLFFCTLILALFVRERKPIGPTEPSDSGGGIKGPFLELFAQKSLWPVYLLVFGTVFMGSGLGNFEALLIFEQWGYSKQDMGTNMFVGGMLNLFLVIPLIAYFTRNMDKLKMFTIGIVGAMIARIAYYIFVQFFLPDQRPTIGHMIFFGQLQSMIGQFTTIALMPLIFDYIPRDKMGTAQAGMNLVRSITRMVTLNGLGIWVTLYSFWFMPEGTYNYFSGYLFMILLDFVGLAILIYFAWKVRTGAIKPLGVTEFHPIEESGGTATNQPRTD